MIKLLVVILMSSISSDGGVAVTVHESRFTDMQSCLQAKQWFEGQDNMLNGVSDRSSARGTKSLTITATCIEQKSRP